MDLDFVDLFEDFAGVGFDVDFEDVDLFAVVGDVLVEVFLDVDDLDVDGGNLDLEVNPDGDDAGHKSEEADGVGDGEAEDTGVFYHGLGVLS